MEKLRRTRRTVLRALTLGVAALPLWRFLNPAASAERPVVRAKREDIPLDGALVFREERVALLRRKGEIFALSLSCTHLGCTVSVTPRELVCPCHGSIFAPTGEVLRGPATRPLSRLEVRQEEDWVVVLG